MQIRYFTLVVLLLLCAACAPKQVQVDVPLIPASPEEVNLYFNKFKSYAQQQSEVNVPFRIQLGLRYNDGGELKRANAIIWGNNKLPDRLPVRLDVMASLGVTLARIREASQEIIIYSPRENKAWIHSGRGKAMFSIGMPVPITIQDIISLMQGRFNDVFEKLAWSKADRIGPQTIQYTIESSRLSGQIIINSQGLLVGWKEKQGDWSMSLKYADSIPPLPDQIIIENENGHKAELNIKDFELVNKEFSEDQLKLSLPEKVEVQQLTKISK